MRTSGHRKEGSGNDSALPSALTDLRLDAHQWRSSQVHGLHPMLGAEREAESRGREESSLRCGQGYLTFAFGQAHAMNLPCGQRIREEQCQPVVGIQKAMSPHGTIPRTSPEASSASQALTVWSGPRAPLSRASSPGSSCAQGCHLH